jgi:hypothetical protein
MCISRPPITVVFDQGIRHYRLPTVPRGRGPMFLHFNFRWIDTEFRSSERDGWTFNASNTVRAQRSYTFNDRCALAHAKPFLNCR